MDDHPRMSAARPPSENQRRWRRRSPEWLYVPAAVLACLLLWAGGLRAHQVSAVGAEAKFFRDGAYQFGLSLEVEASQDPALNDEISPEQAVLEYLRAGITFLFDDSVVRPQFTKPAPVSEAPAETGTLPRVQLYTEARGRVPDGAGAFYVKLSPDTEVALVLLVERDGVRERRARTLFAGEISRPVDLTFLTLPRREEDPFEAEGAQPEPAGSKGVMLRLGSEWLFGSGGRGAVLLVALLLVGISPQAAGLQAVTFLGAIFFGQLLFGLGSGPAREGVAAVASALLLAGAAAHNLKAPPHLTWPRYALAGLSGFFLGMFSPGKMLPGFLAGQALAVLACTFLVWLVLGGFWKQSWYGARLLRPASWLFLGWAAYWLWKGE